ncbi:MAG TPA: FHA domain-containing protein [Clostridiaceae bacterium]|nr:FHA domain-containing protein [Clostridiaceae bacterium]
MEFLKDVYHVFYEYGVSSSYLILESSQATKVKNYQVEMIARNKVENILPLDIRFNNESTSLYYNITSQLQLSQLLKRRKISMDELIKILWSIGKTLIGSKEFLLNENNFVLNEDYIFINPANLQVSLVYLPVDMEGDILQEYKDFILRMILDIADIDEGACDNYLHKILMSVKSETFNIKNFTNMLEHMTAMKSGPCTENESITEPDQYIYVQEDDRGFGNGSGNEGSKGKNDNSKNDKDKNCEDKRRNTKLIVFMAIIAIQVAAIVIVFINKYVVLPSENNSWNTYFGVALVIGAVNFVLLRRIWVSGSEKQVNIPSPKAEPDKNSFKEEKYWNEIENMDMKIDLEKQRGLDMEKVKLNHNDTVLLSSNENHPFLKGANKDNNELIFISKGDFLIGRLKGYVDHVISNEAIGKIHAQIICLENQYYIKDLNSVNGTYINNVRIESNKEYKIFNGDRITLANEDYIFINPTLFEAG